MNTKPPSSSIDPWQNYEQRAQTLAQQADPQALLNLVQEMSAAGKQLTKNLMTDSLTGAYNRHGWDVRMQERMAHLARHPEQTDMVVSVDLDKLTLINNTYGHNAGDAAIRAISQTLKSSVRPDDDIVARTGGDEIRLRLGSISQEDGEKRIKSLEYKLSQLAIPVQHEGREIMLPISASLGGALLKHGDDPDAVFAAADEKMYASKTAKGVSREQLEAAVADPPSTERSRTSAATPDSPNPLPQTPRAGTQYSDLARTGFNSVVDVVAQAEAAAATQKGTTRKVASFAATLARTGFDALHQAIDNKKPDAVPESGKVAKTAPQNGNLTRRLFRLGREG
ncbi:MAG: GGDEF domain-containing protein [Alphaproteobacteria bacterium]